MTKTIESPDDSTTTEESTSSSTEIKGHQWIITSACCLIVMFTLGIARSTPVLLQDVETTYNLTEKASAMYIAFPMTFGGIMAPIAAYVCRIYKVRPVCLIFSIIAFGSLFSSVFFKSLGFIPFLVLTTIAGFFHGGVLVSAPVEVNKWFKPKQRSLANALVWTGSSIGALWVGPCLAFFGSREGWNWKDALVILSAVQVVVLVISSLLLKPPPSAKNQNKNLYERQSFWQLLKHYPLYRVYLCTQFGYVFWRSAYYVFLIKFAEQELKFGKSESALLITIDAACEIVFRPLAGKLAQNHSRYLCLSIIYAMQSFCTIFPPSISSYVIFSTLVAIIGALQGAQGGLDMTTIVDTVGVDLARDAYAKSCFIEVFLAGLATFLFGHFGSHMRFYLGACSLSCSSIMAFVGYWMSSKASSVNYKEAEQLKN